MKRVRGDDLALGDAILGRMALSDTCASRVRELVSSAGPEMTSGQEPLFSANELRALRDGRVPEEVIHARRSSSSVQALQLRVQTQEGFPHVRPENWVALLCGARNLRYFMNTSSLVIGRGRRCDLSLACEGPNATLSRRHLFLQLKSDGLWMRNSGRAPCVVSGVLLASGDTMLLPPICRIELASIVIVIATRLA